MVFLEGEKEWIFEDKEGGRGRYWITRRGRVLTMRERKTRTGKQENEMTSEQENKRTSKSRRIGHARGLTGPKTSSDRGSSRAKNERRRPGIEPKTSGERGARARKRAANEGYRGEKLNSECRALYTNVNVGKNSEK